MNLNENFAAEDILLDDDGSYLTLTLSPLSLFTVMLCNLRGLILTLTANLAFAVTSDFICFYHLPRKEYLYVHNL